MDMEDVFAPEQKIDTVVDDDEIYEKIEAPKYVDLTRPDQFLPDDDRSWFCLRIGCDQNHEDVDPDALHKSFVLRVMAARSPNLRLRKALRSRQVPSAYMNCPKSAPPKPSNSRVCKFTAMSTASQRMADVKVKVRPLPKIISTPIVKPKESSVAAKALTTPRVKKSIPSSDHFRSVQNPKRTDAVLKNKLVAKALVFNTPKKTERKKSLLETEIPMTEICNRMKKLQLNSQRKKLSWNSSKSSRCTASRPKKSTAASDPSTFELYSQKLKSRVKDTKDCKDLGVKASKYTKSTGTKCTQRPHSITDSDMDIDGGSRNGSLGVFSTSGICRSKEAISNEEKLGVVTTQEECLPYLETPSTGEKVQTVIDVSSYTDPSSLSKAEKVSEEEYPLHLQILNGEDDIEVSTGVTNAITKALVYNTPKKSERNKSLLEPETPLTDICNGLKKLEINSQRKKPSRNSSKLSKCHPSTSKKLKAQSKDSEDCKDLGATSSKYMKSASTKYIQKPRCSRPHSITDNGKEVDGGLGNGSFNVCSVSGTSKSKEGNGNEEQSGDFVMITLGVTVSVQGECLSSLKTSLIGEKVEMVIEDVSSCPNARSVANPEKASDDEYPLDLQIPNGDGGIDVRKGDESGRRLDLKVSEDRDDSLGGTKSGEEDVFVDIPSHNPASYLQNSEKHLEKEEHIELQTVKDVGDVEGIKGDDEHRRGPEVVSVFLTANSVGLVGEVINSDDKENATTFDDNRKINLNNAHSQIINLQSEAHENQQKVISAQVKFCKGNLAVVTTGSLAKYKKTKPTNPKPFRLRTDERGILREANLEKRNLPVPLKEITQVSQNSDGSTQRRHTNEPKVKTHGQQEGNQIELDKRNRKMKPQQTRSTNNKTSKSVVEPKTTNSAQTRMKLEYCMEKEPKKGERQTNKSQLLRPRLIRPQRGTGIRKATISLVASRRLSVIKETSSTIVRPRDPKSKNKGTLTAAAAAAASSYAGISSSQRKKPVTIPKEPNFHRIHTPKRCTKTVPEAIRTPKSCIKTIAEAIPKEPNFHRIHTPKRCTKTVAEAIHTPKS